MKKTLFKKKLFEKNTLNKHIKKAKNYLFLLKKNSFKLKHK